jgi:Zn-dependent protease with chaperone function
MARRASLAFRAALAVFFLVTFYVLAIAIAAALIALPVFMFVYGRRLDLRIAIFCFAAAGAILWSIVPRPDRFLPPGPRLKPQDHERLFEVLGGVAKKLGETMPTEVYLVPDVNAFVTQRGGFMGAGSRRIMGLGLPLLQVLTVSELRGVVAHELGHFAGGDTALGPWIYKTRAALVRTLQSLGGGPLGWVFLQYFKLFLRVTLAVSRSQELKADEIAVQLVGSKAMAAGLQKSHAADPAFSAFMDQEYLPVLRAGFRPPLAQGFERFLAAQLVVDAMSRTVKRELRGRRTDPYDSHPPLKERIAAMEKLHAGKTPREDPPAISLLEEIEGLEAQLLAMVLGPKVKKLEPLAWEEAVTKVLVPGWESVVAEHGAALAGLSAETIPGRTGDFAKLARGLVPKGARVPKDELVRGAVSLVGAALALALVKNGWTVTSDPGQPTVLAREGASIEPFGLLGKLVAEKLSREEWSAAWEPTGVAAVDLGTIVAPKAKAPPPAKTPMKRITRKRPRRELEEDA